MFLVRKGNPKGIKDWDDLVRPGIQVITPNPKTSGGARWNYLAAWGFALSKYGNDEAKAKDFVARLFKNVPVLDTGARGSTVTFVERGLGDVLIAWENEALLAVRELGKDKLELVAPQRSILAEPPVAVVDKVAAKHGTTELAKAYLTYLYSDPGQEIVAKNFYRPRNAAVAGRYASQFPKIELFTIDKVFGGWDRAQKVHFADGASSIRSSERAGDRRRPARPPGFTPAISLTVGYVSLLILIPLATLVLKTASLSPAAFWAAVTSPRALAAYRLSIVTAFAGGAINAVFGTIVAWVLVRYQFPGSASWTPWSTFRSRSRRPSRASR